MVLVVGVEGRLGSRSVLALGVVEELVRRERRCEDRRAALARDI